MRMTHSVLGPHQTVLRSLLTIFWWVAVWGFVECALLLVFKESVLMKMATYMIIISFIFFLVIINPDLIKHL